jgi:hypothetical protein
MEVVTKVGLTVIYIYICVVYNDGILSIFTIFLFIILFLSPKPPEEKKKEAEWADEESDVVHLTDSNFDEYLQTHPFSMFPRQVT